MTTASSGSQVRDFAKPNETRDFPLGALELLSFGDDVIGRLTVEPGWRWSQSLGPIMGTDMCQAAHFAYCISGTMRITMAGGETFDIGPGQCGYVVRPATTRRWSAPSRA